MTDHDFMEIGRVIVRFALAAATITGDNPAVIARDETKRHSTQIADKVIARAAVVEHDRSAVAAWIKGEMFTAILIAFDEIANGDGWKEIKLPYVRWAAEIEELTRATTDRVSLYIVGCANRRIANRAGKHLSLIVQRRAAELLHGYPIPRAGRAAVVNWLCDVAGKALDRRVNELRARAVAMGGRA